MEKFAAIDFETANWQQTSVCSVGIVVMNRGVIEDRLQSDSSCTEFLFPA